MLREEWRVVHISSSLGVAPPIARNLVRQLNEVRVDVRDVRCLDNEDWIVVFRCAEDFMTPWPG